MNLVKISYLFPIFLAAFVFVSPVYSSQEGTLILSEFKIESAGIGESGKIKLSGHQDHSGFSRIEIEAFDKKYRLSDKQLKKLNGLLWNGVQLTYERGYEKLGGRTVYIRFSNGFSSATRDVRFVVVKENGDLSVEDKLF